MKKTISRILASLLMLAALGSVLPQKALALSDDPSAEIPVKILLKGTLPAAKEYFRVKLQGEDGAPMPEGTQGDTALLLVRGEKEANEKKFPPITYEKVGTYRYTLWQEAGENSTCSQVDKTVYRVTVMVYSGQEGLKMIIQEKDQEQKYPEAQFTNVYKEAPPKDSPKTSDDSNFARDVCMSIAGMGILLMLLLTHKPRQPEE